MVRNRYDTLLIIASAIFLSCKSVKQIPVVNTHVDSTSINSTTYDSLRWDKLLKDSTFLSKFYVHDTIRIDSVKIVEKADGTTDTYNTRYEKIVVIEKDTVYKNVQDYQLIESYKSQIDSLMHVQKDSVDVIVEVEKDLSKIDKFLLRFGRFSFVFVLVAIAYLAYYVFRKFKGK